VQPDNFEFFNQKKKKKPAATPAPPRKKITMNYNVVLDMSVLDVMTGDDYC
jgi:hypothetical protein